MSLRTQDCRGREAPCVPSSGARSSSGTALAAPAFPESVRCMPDGGNTMWISSSFPVRRPPTGHWYFCEEPCSTAFFCLLMPCEPLWLQGRTAAVPPGALPRSGFRSSLSRRHQCQILFLRIQSNPEVLQRFLDNGLQTLHPPAPESALRVLCRGRPCGVGGMCRPFLSVPWCEACRLLTLFPSSRSPALRLSGRLLCLCSSLIRRDRGSMLLARGMSDDAALPRLLGRIRIRNDASKQSETGLPLPDALRHALYTSYTSYTSTATRSVFLRTTAANRARPGRHFSVHTVHTVHTAYGIQNSLQGTPYVVRCPQQRVWLSRQARPTRRASLCLSVTQQAVSSPWPMAWLTLDDHARGPGWPLLSFAPFRR